MTELALDSVSESGSGSGWQGKTDGLWWKVTPGAVAIPFVARNLVISGGIGVVGSTGSCHETDSNTSSLRRLMR